MVAYSHRSSLEFCVRPTHQVMNRKCTVEVLNDLLVSFIRMTPDRITLGFDDVKGRPSDRLPDIINNPSSVDEVFRMVPDLR